VSFAKRVLSQSFQYDWLGNTAQTGDEARGFYDRSLGTITNGVAGAGPYQLHNATNASSTPGSPSREGRLTAAYDPAGYLTSLAGVGRVVPSASTRSRRRSLSAHVGGSALRREIMGSVYPRKNKLWIRFKGADGA
jgi:hypothetical protein